MNPFDLHGPDFLLFYSVLGVVVVALVVLSKRPGVASGIDPKDLTDPYLIACLRGGTDEAIRIATCVLLERGLLRAEAALLRATRPDAAYLAAKPIERAILKEFGEAREADEMFRSPPIVAAAAELQQELIDRGLAPSPNRRMAAGAGSLLLLGVAAIKIFVAVSRGRTNFLYLILLAGLFSVLLWKIAGLRQTLRGFRALADLRSLLKGSRALAFTGGGKTGDLALLAGVFGLAAAFSHQLGSQFRSLFPKSANEKGRVTNFGSSCGSSSVSSCGSSGGSSCGGGGCGGGCGGCGGS